MVAQKPTKCWFLLNEKVGDGYIIWYPKLDKVHLNMKIQNKTIKPHENYTYWLAVLAKIIKICC